MSTPPKKGRVVHDGVSVSATTSASGPPATSIHVEVDRAELERQMGQPAEIERVTCEVPEQQGTSDVGWRTETMPRVSSEVRAARPDEAGPAAKVVDVYGQMLYGPSDVARYGVAVTLETKAGTVLAQEPDETYSAHEADRPEPTEKRRKLEEPKDG